MMNDSDKAELMESIKGKGILECQDKEMRFIKKAVSMYMDIDDTLDFGVNIGLNYNAMNHYINQYMGTCGLSY